MMRIRTASNFPRPALPHIMKLRANRPFSTPRPSEIKRVAVIAGEMEVAEEISKLVRDRLEELTCGNVFRQRMLIAVYATLKPRDVSVFYAHAIPEVQQSDRFVINKAVDMVFVDNTLVGVSGPEIVRRIIIGKKRVQPFIFGISDRDDEFDSSTVFYRAGADLTLYRPFIGDCALGQFFGRD